MPPRGVKKGTKRARQYEHIKESLVERGESEDTAEEIAARTVNKERARHGESRTASKSSTDDISSGRRGGLRSHRGAQGRTKEQLYQEARRKGVSRAIEDDEGTVAARCGPGQPMNAAGLLGATVHVGERAVGNVTGVLVDDGRAPVLLRIHLFGTEGTAYIPRAAVDELPGGGLHASNISVLMQSGEASFYEERALGWVSSGDEVWAAADAGIVPQGVDE